MLFSGTDFINSDASTYIAPTIKTGDYGKVFVKAYASSGAAVDTGKLLNYGHSTGYEGYMATALIASVKGLFGYTEAAVASGCVGWFTVRGFVDSAQGQTGSFQGSIGHAVYFCASGIGVADGAFNGGMSQIGIIHADVNACTTATIYLVGNMQAEV